MLWSALRLPSTDDPPSPTDAALQALAVWALQFTPRVAVAEEAVLLEVGASLRLFGGRAALRERLWPGACELGAVALAWAPNALAALALARAGVEDGVSAPLERALDALPMATLSVVRPHLPTLSRIGCRTLGDVRRLPRAGLARRFDAALLAALDQAYGRAPETHVWVVLPAVFDARLELPHRVDDAGALVSGARRLLLQLSAWLAARHSGVTAFTLHWAHDAMRSRGVGEGGQLTVRTAEATREAGHLARLLAEHLSHVVLAAPVGDLRLTAEGVVPLAPQSASWLPGDARSQEPLAQVLERLAARLGEDRVVRPVLCEDHRPEAMGRWQPAAQVLPREAWPVQPAGPQPTLLLARPLKLLVRQHRPIYQGELQLLLGPQRVEGGWWDRDETAGQARHAVRDYWVARSPLAGVLWVFQTRLADEPAWFLHGVFA
ncbi:Y-family DNA polymerase [Hydrogenophaga pseudoflava]|uniref:Y-family DNA polymerase n=1 Tax=Hydrogenophaga pseudoflava TaxID=47421 RepID=UPI0027E4B9AA|nr:DNA polymerase Y family protein [Hydrogenophaga pseudoflava]MDQ7743295.1 DNA polymerase Y family protein [Hydrogenophaga pseudoflava]